MEKKRTVGIAGYHIYILIIYYMKIVGTNHSQCSINSNRYVKDKLWRTPWAFWHNMDTRSHEGTLRTYGVHKLVCYGSTHTLSCFPIWWLKGNVSLKYIEIQTKTEKSWKQSHGVDTVQQAVGGSIIKKYDCKRKKRQLSDTISHWTAT